MGLINKSDFQSIYNNLKRFADGLKERDNFPGTFYSLNYTGQAIKNTIYSLPVFPSGEGNRKKTHFSLF